MSCHVDRPGTYITKRWIPKLQLFVPPIPSDQRAHSFIPTLKGSVSPNSHSHLGERETEMLPSFNWRHWSTNGWSCLKAPKQPVAEPETHHWPLGLTYLLLCCYLLCSFSFVHWTGVMASRNLLFNSYLLGHPVPTPIRRLFQSLTPLIIRNLFLIPGLTVSHFMQLFLCQYSLLGLNRSFPSLGFIPPVCLSTAIGPPTSLFCSVRLNVPNSFSPFT